MDEFPYYEDDRRQGSAILLRWADHTGKFHEARKYALLAKADTSADAAGSHFGHSGHLRPTGHG